MDAHGKASSSQAPLLYPIIHTNTAAFPTAQGSFQTEMRTENTSSIWEKKVWWSALQTAFGIYLKGRKPFNGLNTK